MVVATVTMPQLGESVTEGTVVQWLKQEGDPVQRDEPLLEVETEKVTVEVPSPFAGTVQRILVHEGETVPVGTTLVEIETADVVTPRPQLAAEMTAPGGAPEGVPTGPGRTAVEERAGTTWYSPAVMRLAQEYQLDLAQVKGTGEGGRVTRKDVLAFIKVQREATPAQPAAGAAPGASAEGAALAPQIVPLSPTRRTIAQRMAESAQTVPHVWMMIEVDMTTLVRWRESIKESFRQQEGVDLTYLPFVIKATVEALKEFPLLNSSWSEQGIIMKREINIGVAVATDEGLIVPVIKGADGKSIAGIARELADLAERARSRSLRLEDVQGGTFTVDNTGAFGSIVSKPLVNPPQAAILTSEAIVKRPVVIDDAIAIRHMMNMCISFDHRIVDGAEVGRFMQTVRRRLESYGLGTSLY